MAAVTLDFLTEQLELGEQLLHARGTMFTPQDLPGRYGRVVKAIDHLLEVLKCEAVVAGGWAVWHHGYFGRMTQDIDIALAKDQIDAFLHAAAVSGFEVLPQQPESYSSTKFEICAVSGFRVRRFRIAGRADRSESPPITSS